MRELVLSDQSCPLAMLVADEVPKLAMRYVDCADRLRD